MLFRSQDKALHDIAQCRTASLGGHVAVYECGHEVTAYNSCRNRHCPRCLAGKSFEWVEQKERDLLPVPYFHVVFTLPAELLQIPPVARPALYEALFAASSSTLLSFGQKNLGGQLGFLSVLHTWGQTLTLHPHVHVVVAGGAFDVRSRRFVTSRSRFLFPVRALSVVFRGCWEHWECPEWGQQVQRAELPPRRPLPAFHRLAVSQQRERNLWLWCYWQLHKADRRRHPSARCQTISALCHLSRPRCGPLA